MGTRSAVRYLSSAAVHLLPVAALIALWDVASEAFGIPRLFPSPLMTLRTLLRTLADGSLIGNSAASLLRILAGFLLGSLLGIALGLAMGASAFVRYALTPYIDFLRFVSALAWISAFLTWFGIGEASKVLLLVYATTFGVVINVTEGVLAIRPAAIRAAKSLGASPRQIFAWVIIPASVPHMIAGMRVAMQNSFTAVVAAEMLAATRGLGFLIMAARTFMEPDRVFVAIIALGVLGLLADRALVLFGRMALGRYSAAEQR